MFWSTHPSAPRPVSNFPPPLAHQGSDSWSPTFPLWLIADLPISWVETQKCRCPSYLTDLKKENFQDFIKKTWKLTCPLKSDHFSREYIFQPSIFRGRPLVFRGVTLRFSSISWYFLVVSASLAFRNFWAMYQAFFAIQVIAMESTFVDAQL